MSEIKKNDLLAFITLTGNDIIEFAEEGLDDLKNMTEIQGLGELEFFNFAKNDSIIFFDNTYETNNMSKILKD